MFRKIILEIITALLVLLFIYTSVSKFIDHGTFQFQLGRAPYIGRFAGFLAIVLPLAELSIAVLLTISRTRLMGLLASFVIMLLFTFYIALMLASGLHLPCTCGGVIQKMSWPQHLAFNIFFTLIALAGIVVHKKQGRGYEGSNYKLSAS